MQEPAEEGSTPAGRPAVSFAELGPAAAGLTLHHTIPGSSLVVLQNDSGTVLDISKSSMIG